MVAEEVVDGPSGRRRGDVGAFQEGVGVRLGGENQGPLDAGENGGRLAALGRRGERERGGGASLAKSPGERCPDLRGGEEAPRGKREGRVADPRATEDSKWRGNLTCGKLPRGAPARG